MEEQLGVPRAAERGVERGEEVERVEAAVEVALDEVEQVGSPLHVALAGEHDADDLLVHVEEAAGDLAEGSQRQRPHLHPGRHRRDGAARAPAERRVEGPQLRVR